MNAVTTLKVAGQLPVVPQRPAAGQRQLAGRRPAVGQRPAEDQLRPGASSGRLRLTRRGRLLFIGTPLMLAAVAAALLLGFFTSPARAATLGSEPAGAAASKVTVLQGQTLWSIASSADPSRDPRDVVSDIVELNGLRTSVVQPGQQLFVPSHA
ncbi:LysM peptidoglycan-binding domain-containing protein [Paenarthrobacter sp. Z7-10]|uniref:LysM peptidoglycan-binding domain-containing protein n=1 Tax=Paenarthrobacter sp. Z7-10 TaxID=2787635 RepID=UPI0022A9F1AC|nr:LysM peptidoglycan-binding domain-containing protein [Paenarthrobacter sp. Z7-10]MCZ2403718.1 LysM peptidoglycan-binding domain-containing protein [Paenarthrobacter sp. Z7-10]